MKYLSYILVVVSFVLGQVALLSPWVTGLAHNIPNPNAELNAMWRVNPPPFGPEATAEAYFWEPTLSIAPCKVISRTEWSSDDVQQTFRLLRGTGIGLFALQAALWCLFVGLLVWVNHKAIHISLLGIISICVACMVAAIAELTLLGPSISCDPAPGIFIKSVEPVLSTFIILLGGVVTGLAANMMVFWNCRRATTQTVP